MNAFILTLYLLDKRESEVKYYENEAIFEYNLKSQWKEDSFSAIFIIAVNFICVLYISVNTVKEFRNTWDFEFNLHDSHDVVFWYSEFILLKFLANIRSYEIPLQKIPIIVLHVMT